MENPTTFKEYLDYLYRIGRRTAVDIDPERATAVMTEAEQIKMAGLLLKDDEKKPHFDLSFYSIDMLINDSGTSRDIVIHLIRKFYAEHYKQKMDDLLKEYKPEEQDGA